MTVLVYSRPTCAPCKTLKTWLKNKGIIYKEFDLDKTKTDFRMAPTIIVGDEIISGLNLRRIAELLNLV